MPIAGYDEFRIRSYCAFQDSIICIVISDD